MAFDHDATSWAPETFALHGGYDPSSCAGAVKMPVFATSTFKASTAEELELWFRQAYGLDGPPQEPDGMVYSRVGNPNLQKVEKVWCVFEGAQETALFSSGMAAISTAIMALCESGDIVLYSAPVYGGTYFLLEKLLSKFGIRGEQFPVSMSTEAFEVFLGAHPERDRIKVLYLETPANPTLEIADIRGLCEVVHRVLSDPYVVVDNTVLGPLILKPLELGVDLVVHSATKSIGGHSDLIAGIVAGSSKLVTVVKVHRTLLGNMCDPQTAWLLSRSLETYKIRVEESARTAIAIAQFLDGHPKVEEVLFPGFGRVMTDEHRRLRQIHFSQSLGGRRSHGSLMSIRLVGGKAEAYRFLNALKLICLAVSLGGTESLAEHPRTHTHSDMSETDLDFCKVTHNLVRISIGLESKQDLIRDLRQALEQV